MGTRTQKKAGVALLFAEKIDFKPRLIKRHEDSHYIFIKGIICEEEITIINTCAPNTIIPPI